VLKNFRKFVTNEEVPELGLSALADVHHRQHFLYFYLQGQQ
jgi:hypothetical protein